MKHIEMHCHSTRSDGKNTPAEVIAEAQRLNLDFLALTDHDVVSPQDFQESLRQSWIETCDSTEVSARNYDIWKSLHLTSYAKIFHESLHEVLKNSRNGKKSMRDGQLEKLIHEFGFKGSKAGFEAFMQTKLGREIDTSNKYDMSHYLMSYSENKEKAIQILWDLLKDNDVVLHFYLECLKREWAFYDTYGHEVEEYEPSVEQTVREVSEKSWWLVSLAHPNVTFWGNKGWIPEFERTLPDYVKKWVRGVEINSIASWDWVQAVLKARQKYDLILTFGSDCHNIWKTDQKHSTIWRINPFVENKVLKDNFGNFKEKIWI